MGDERDVDPGAQVAWASPTVRALAALTLLVILLVGASSAEAGRKVSPARARAIQDLIDVVAAERAQERAERKATAEAKRLRRERKVEAALRLGGALKAEKARRKAVAREAARPAAPSAEVQLLLLRAGLLRR